MKNITPSDIEILCGLPSNSLSVTVGNNLFIFNPDIPIQFKDTVISLLNSGVADDWIAVPLVIAREIDARRLRLALLELGRLAAVEAAVASLGQAAIIDWEYATTIREDYPLAQALSSQLGLDVDAVFDLAETLT